MDVVILVLLKINAKGSWFCWSKQHLFEYLKDDDKVSYRVVSHCNGKDIKF